MFDLLIDTSESWFLRYDSAESSIGRILVLMSDDGVVDVILGDSLSQMLWQARQRFPGSGFVPDRGRHLDWVAAVVKRLETTAPGCDVVPLDLGFGFAGRAAG